MAKGTVKFFDETKGFGFITPEEGSNDLFVHMTGVLDGAYLQDGDSVEYEIGEGRKGPCAVQVKKI